MSMTLPETEMIFDGWADAPPAHLVLGRIEAMLGAWLGIKRNAPMVAGAEDSSGRGTAETLAIMPGMVMGAPVKLPADNVFDFATLTARHAQRRAGAG